MRDWHETLAKWNEVDAALTSAVDEARDHWGWAFDEMTDAQGEGLNAFFGATHKLAAAALAHIAAIEAENARLTHSLRDVRDYKNRRINELVQQLDDRNTGGKRMSE